MFNVESCSYVLLRKRYERATTRSKMFGKLCKLTGKSNVLRSQNH